MSKLWMRCLFLYHVLFVWSCLFSTHIFLEGRCSSAKSIQWKFPPVYCCLCRPPLLLQYQWIMYDLLFSSCLVFDNPSAVGTPSSLCCIPWEWPGNCWLSMQHCRTCRRQACTLSLCPTSTTSPLITTPSSSSSWSPTFPVSQHADFSFFFPLS